MKKMVMVMCKDSALNVKPGIIRQEQNVPDLSSNKILLAVPKSAMIHG